MFNEWLVCVVVSFHEQTFVQGVVPSATSLHHINANILGYYHRQCFRILVTIQFYPSVAIVAREFPARHLRLRMPVPGCRRTERTTSEAVAGVLLLYVESPVVPFSDMFYYNND